MSLKSGNAKNLFIICAGQPRTGTSSMRDALDQLGFKCYHMRQVFVEGADHQTKWIKLGQKKLKLKKAKNITTYKQWNEINVDYDWDEIFKSTKDGLPYKAAADAPIYGFYQEIMKKYPNHRVILTVRDSSRTWHESALSTIYYPSRYWWGHLYFYLFQNGLYRHNRLAIDCVWDLMFSLKFENSKYAQNKYHEWNQSVIDYVGKDKLLIFNAKHDGWDKLCKFLDIDEENIPKEAFPHSNERKTLQKIQNKTRWKAYGFDAILVGAVIMGLVTAIKLYKTGGDQINIVDKNQTPLGQQ